VLATCGGDDSGSATVATTLSHATSASSASATTIAVTTTVAPAATTRATTATTAKAAASAGSLSSPVPMGTAADIGDGWMFKVVSYQPDGAADVAAANQFNKPAPAGQVYVIANFEAAYNGDQDKAKPIFSIKAVGPSKKSYNAYDSFVVAPDPKYELSTDVFKGSSTAGNEVFTVGAADANGLIFYTSAGFSGDDVYFATS
jgi:hypothetical protein